MCDYEADTNAMISCAEFIAARERIRAASAECDSCGKRGATHSIPFGPGNSIGDGTFCCDCKRPRCKPDCIDEQASEEVHV